MNDITKARAFLSRRESDLQHLESFGLMFATAQKKYLDIRRRQVGNKDVPGTWDSKEVEAALDYAALKYLKKYGNLPRNVALAFRQGVTLEEKQNLAREWANA